MNAPLLQRLENRMNRKLADIRECERKSRDIELQRERLRGEVSSLEDAIDEVKREMPAIPPGGGGGFSSQTPDEEKRPNDLKLSDCGGVARAVPNATDEGGATN